MAGFEREWRRDAGLNSFHEHWGMCGAGLHVVFNWGVEGGRVAVAYFRITTCAQREAFSSTLTEVLFLGDVH